MAGILITGATGNVGSRLLREYLTTTDDILYVLVRAEADAAAATRIEQVLAFWDVADERSRARVRVLRGDILADNLGLTAAQVDEVRRAVRVVVHAACNLRLDLTVEQARREVLGGTVNVVRFAEQLDQLDRFGYLSTMEVMGRYCGSVREEFLTPYRIPFLNSYEVAKFESEEFLRERLAAGTPVTIYRSSMVVGETATGKVLDFQSFYLLLEKLVLRPDFPVLPAGAPMDTIPVDFLCRCIVTTLADPQSNGRIYHLSQGQDDAVAFTELRELVRPLADAQLGRPVPATLLVPAGVHRTLFRLLATCTWGRWRRYFRVQLLFLQFFRLPGQFVNDQTKRELAALGLVWPKFRAYLPHLLAYYFAHRQQKRLPF